MSHKKNIAETVRYNYQTFTYEEININRELDTYISKDHDAVKSSGKDWQGFYQLDHVATPGFLFDTLSAKRCSVQGESVHASNSSFPRSQIQD